MFRQTISKRCQTFSNHIISNQHFFCTAQLQKLNRINLNSCKCFQNLTDEHIRIYATMQSFENMLNKIATTNEKILNVSKEQAKDFNKFLKFARNYQLHHHEKEEALYASLIENTEADFTVEMVKAVEMEHIEMLQMSGLIISKKAINTIEIKPYLSFIQSTYDHMFEESNDIFPMIQNKLTQNQMQQIAEYFDEYDYCKAEIIAASNLLSDQLQQKYA